MTTRSLTARHAARTDVGRARDHNEDRVLARPPLYVVADGLGGHSAGEVAAQMLVDRLARLHASATGADLVAAIEAADAEIREAASTGSGRHGMSTTCVALLLGDDARVSHVGDSRAYRLRSGRLERLTEDHSVVAELVRAGIITEAQAGTDDRRHLLTQALGSEPQAAVTTTDLSVEAGDRYLLCSDGLSGQVSDAAIESLLGEIRDPDAAADELVRRANRAGGVDNVSVVVVDVSAAETPAVEEARKSGPSPPSRGRAPGVASAILLVLAVALLAGAILAAVVSPQPVSPSFPAPSASPSSSTNPSVTPSSGSSAVVSPPANAPSVAPGASAAR